MIRRMVVRDIPRVADLGKSFYLEAQQNRYTTYDNETARISLLQWLRSPHVLCLVAIDSDTDEPEPIGYFVANLFTPISDAGVVFAQEAMVYVEPRYRGRGTGKLFVKYFEDWAKTQNATHVIMGHRGNFMRREVGNLLASQGFEPYEQTYIKRVDHA